MLFIQYYTTISHSHDTVQGLLNPNSRSHLCVGMYVQDRCFYSAVYSLPGEVQRSYSSRGCSLFLSGSQAHICRCWLADDIVHRRVEVKPLLVSVSPAPSLSALYLLPDISRVGLLLILHVLPPEHFKRMVQSSCPRRSPNDRRALSYVLYKKSE